ncbi:hypothetical protein AVEN_91236-1 [Araneus ventricosus]|uniref:Uncharacterized protein n=1 Tax=Araneus ventricosus TaxID=182803 RepID=A0A4Y2X1L7_ARAVE|nr:hypothetical protein AVEN_91236-1 [Araneus ventricosus]
MVAQKFFTIRRKPPPVTPLKCPTKDTSPHLVSEQVENSCGVSFCITGQHTDARLSRVTRGNNDCKKFEDWFICHHPLPVGEYVMLLSTGVVRDEKMNCHPSDMEAIDRSNFGQVKFSRINRFVPMRGFTNIVKLHEEEVQIDPYTIFKSISFNRKTESELKNYCSFELAPYPSSLFHEQGMMRKSRESVCYDLFNPVNTPSNIENALYVNDGGFLLHRVTWELREKFSSTLNRYVEYVTKYFGARSIIVYNTTDYAERKVPIKLKIIGNKKSLISMLIKKFAGENITVQQVVEDAESTIVSKAVEGARQSDCVFIVGKDMDLPVILTTLAPDNNLLFLMKPGKKTETIFYSPTHFKMSKKVKDNKLFLHAFN